MFSLQPISPHFEKHIRVFYKGTTSLVLFSQHSPTSYAIFLCLHWPTVTEAGIDFDLCSEFSKPELKYGFSMKEINHWHLSEIKNAQWISISIGMTFGKYFQIYTNLRILHIHKKDTAEVTQKKVTAEAQLSQWPNEKFFSQLNVTGNNCCRKIQHNLVWQLNVRKNINFIAKSQTVQGDSVLLQSHPLIE